MKAHSERVPRKNFRELAGKPLVKWILDTLLSLEEVSLVVINTDARRELKDVGVEESDRILIRDRKPDLCGDMVSMNLILQDDIQAVDSKLYLMTHTTNPLLSANSIRRGVEAFQASKDRDSLFSVNKVQTRFYRRDTTPVNHDPDNLVRTQDLEPWFEENSCMYLFTRESFKSTGARIGRSPEMLVIPPAEAIDIDEQFQWDVAEALLEKQNREVPAP
jgi:CMP-N-acetylneuraminic acid synthetase